MLSHTEYVEQAYLFDLLGQRSSELIPMQELLDQLRHELLSTTNLPMAIDFMLGELRHSGMMSPAMKHLSHYFTPFQTFLITEAESEHGRFTMPIALRVLHFDAKLRGDYALALEPTADVADGLAESNSGPNSGRNGGPSARGPGGTAADRVRHSRSGFFFFQFETLCRNRLGYDKGLTAMSGDPVFDDDWRAWLLQLRANVGLVDLADLLFLTSDDYVRRLRAAGQPLPTKAILFGEKEGRIAFANRRKDPLYLFGAMQRHLGYPPVPRMLVVEHDVDTIPQLLRRLERLETRLKIMEQEQKEEFDLTKFYQKPSS